MRFRIAAGVGLLASLLVLTPFSAWAEESKDPAGAQPASGEKFSLTSAIPELLYSLNNFPTYYGAPNTSVGDFWTNTQLLGNAGGVRDTLVKNGIYADVYTSTIYQGTSGGKQSNGGEVQGRLEGFLNLDSGKLGLWPGGLVHMKGELRVGRSVNGDTGALMPVNFLAVQPEFIQRTSIALSEWYLAQALGKEWLAFLGKVNLGGLADQNVFANNAKHQFLNTALVNNPMLLLYAPYTPLSAVIAYQPNQTLSIVTAAANTDDSAVRSGFDTLGQNFTVAQQFQLNYQPADLPGHFRFIWNFNTRKTVDFGASPRAMGQSVLFGTPLPTVSGQYAFMFNFDQYLWVKPGDAARRRRNLENARFPDIYRKYLSPRGVGIFGRFGTGPKTRNALDLTGSFGVGAKGIIEGRDLDQFGVGWYYTRLTPELTDGPLRAFEIEPEQGVELYYNFAITPALSLSADLQFIINPAAGDTRTFEDSSLAIVGGVRLQANF